MKLTGMTVLLQVYNMKESIKFYRDLLGLHVLKTSGGDDYYWAYLKNENMCLMLNTGYEGDTRPHTRDTKSVKVHNDIIVYFNCEDVFEVYKHLTAKSWPVAKPEKTDFGTYQVYTNDPDGYEICFQQLITE